MIKSNKASIKFSLKNTSKSLFYLYFKELRKNESTLNIKAGDLKNRPYT